MGKILLILFIFILPKTMGAQTTGGKINVSSSFVIPDCPPKAKDFCQGYLMLNKGMVPGGVYIIKPSGALEWNLQFSQYGVKVAQLTEDNTVLALLGTESDNSSYGRRIAEFSPDGDTLMNLYFDTAALIASPHHEVLKTKKGSYITLVQEKRIFNLTASGGKIRDTITGDGIMIFDKSGKTQWYWSIFDHLDPLKQNNLIKTKNDWVHANGLSVDTDGHYLISFLHLEQVWKIHAKTGKLIWKLGKRGDIKMDSTEVFGQIHSFHPTAKGQYLFFDNGVKKAKSRIRAYTIDPLKKEAKLQLNILLPREAFSPRMGNAVSLGDSLFLACSSKADMIVLTDPSGDVLWNLKTAFNSYRVTFIPDEKFRNVFLKTR